MLRASYDINATMDVDATLRHVSALATPQVSAYSAFDLRYEWRPRPGLELSITGQNLLGKHAEYEFIAPFRSEFAPSVYFKVVARF
jgi:iron complex outermembrane receptor protein